MHIDWDDFEVTGISGIKYQYLQITILQLLTMTISK